MKRKIHRTLVIIAIFLLPLVLSSVPEIRKAAASGDWYYNSFGYRKHHNVTGSSDGNLTDYAVQLTVHYGSGTDSGSDVYLNSHSQTDFDDLRFTWFNQTSGSQQPLAYWRETYTDGTSATVWVNIPFISNVTTNKIYIYYGDPSADTASNMSEAFPLLGTDFEAGSMGWIYEENVINGYGADGQVVSEA